MTELKAKAGWRSKLGFGVGAYGVSLVYASVGVLQFYFYTNVMGLNSAQAGTVLFVGALGDAIVDPLVGWLASRTRTRWGRYRPYLIFGAVPMSLAFVATFWIPPIEAGYLFWYAIGSMAIFRAAFQLIYMPYTSMIVVLSGDADERSDIEAWRAWFIAAGSLTISFGALSALDWLSAGDQAMGFLRLAGLISLASAAAFLFTGLVTREQYDGEMPKDESNIWAVIALLGKNNQFWVVVAITVLSQSAYAMLLSSSVAYFEIAFGARELAKWPLAALTAAGLVASLIWPRVSRQFGKRATWMMGLCLSASMLLLAIVLDPSGVIPFAAMFLLVGCGVQAAIIIQFAAVADTLDLGEWITGRRTEAIGFAIMTFAMKSSLAVGNGLTGWCYDLAGYDPAGATTPEVEQAMRFVFLGVPATLFLIAAFTTLFFTLTADQHRSVMRDIAKRRAAVSSD